jgi:hypothetical protein
MKGMDGDGRDISMNNRDAFQYSRIREAWESRGALFGLITPEIAP